MMSEGMLKELTAVNSINVRLRHEVDEAKVAAIAENMASWSGRPVVLYRGDDGELRNITGCHRIAAAGVVGIEFPAWILTPQSADELDRLEFAAANDDIDAASTLRKYGAEIADLVEQG